MVSPADGHRSAEVEQRAEIGGQELRDLVDVLPARRWFDEHVGGAGDARLPEAGADDDGVVVDRDRGAEVIADEAVGGGELGDLQAVARGLSGGGRGEC